MPGTHVASFDGELSRIIAGRSCTRMVFLFTVRTARKCDRIWNRELFVDIRLIELPINRTARKCDRIWNGELFSRHLRVRLIELSINR
jgi:hypothetical protein